MAKYERGVYQPADDGVYDGAEDDGEDAGSRLPLLIVIMLIVVAAFFGVVWLAYTQGVERGRNETPRGIDAAPTSANAASDGTTGSAAPYRGLKIYEQPAPSDEELETATTPPPTPVRKVAAPAPAKAAAAEPPAVKPAVNAKTTTAPPAKSVAAAPPPVPKSMAALNKAPLPGAAMPAGAYVLQVGAYKSEDEANDAWHSYQAKHPLVGGYSPDIKRVDLDDKGIWYRLRIGPFADKDTADGLCDKLKADGGGCFPTKP